ncbi:MAG: citrate lyase holo-[acyl-carrier protein] synthase [Candidatus Thiodiazotropha sp.]
MSYAKLQTEILLARDVREQVLSACQQTTEESLVFVSTAIPGRNKTPYGTYSLFHWALAEIERVFGSVRWQSNLSHDLLGPYILFSTPRDPEETKQLCVEIEEAHPAARLMDLDVYSASVERLGREDIGFPPRCCLLCDDLATNCIRTHRHDSKTLNAHVTRLLNAFSDKTIGCNAG